MSWIAVAGTVVSAGAAAYSASQQSKAAKASAAAGQAQLGTGQTVRGAKEMAEAEQKIRMKYAPQNAQLMANMYNIAAPQIAAQNLAMFKKIDPQSYAGRNLYFKNVQADLKLRTKLDPQFQSEVEQDIRGAQAARGNILGNAPISAEALYLGKAGQDLYDRRLQHMDNFLRAPTPEDHFGSLLGSAGGALSQTMAGSTAPGLAFLGQGAGLSNQNAGMSAQFAAQGAAAQNAPSPWAAAAASAAGSGTQYLNNLAQQPKYAQTTQYGGTLSGTYNNKPVYTPGAY